MQHCPLLQSGGSSDQAVLTGVGQAFCYLCKSKFSNRVEETERAVAVLANPSMAPYGQCTPNGAGECLQSQCMLALRNGFGHT